MTAATPPLALQQGPGNADGLPLEECTYITWFQYADEGLISEFAHTQQLGHA
ncbi:MAG: hypothetical protein R3C97_00250 [Geminicoccaceae bacterium]|nr:hypothetical protein [Dokdonella sp.]